MKLISITKYQFDMLNQLTSINKSTNLVIKQENEHYYQDSLKNNNILSKILIYNLTCQHYKENQQKIDLTSFDTKFLVTIFKNFRFDRFYVDGAPSFAQFLINPPYSMVINADENFIINLLKKNKHIDLYQKNNKMTAYFLIDYFHLYNNLSHHNFSDKFFTFFYDILKKNDYKIHYESLLYHILDEKILFDSDQFNDIFLNCLEKPEYKNIHPIILEQYWSKFIIKNDSIKISKELFLKLVQILDEKKLIYFCEKECDQYLEPKKTQYLNNYNNFFNDFKVIQEKHFLENNLLQSSNINTLKNKI